MKRLLFMAVTWVGLLGCSSTKPPKPVPAPVTTAQRSAAQAAKSSSAGNWQSAAGMWQTVLDQYRLLNDQTNEAVALHNLGEAKAQTGDLKSAHEFLESTAAINSRLKLDDPWWRDQIALLQVEAQSQETNEIGQRFERLIPASKGLPASTVKALFLNELGLWYSRTGNFEAAATTFAEALQLFRAGKDPSGAATVVANQALLLEKQKKPREAADKWLIALREFEALADPNGIAICMAGRGRALVEADEDLPAAEDLLRRAAYNFRHLHSEAKAIETDEWLKKALSVQGRAEAK